MLPGFAAGTQVWALSGPHAIESLRTGDRVLTQDVDTGALTIRPVLAIRRVARQQPIKTIAVGNDSITATGLERLWLAGKGWVMAGDLKPGDLIRAIGGVRSITKIEDGAARPVYHIQVGDGRGIVVGQVGVLAHDEQLGQPVASAFDSVVIDGSQPPR
jgi:hypothetical protein